MPEVTGMLFLLLEFTLLFVNDAFLVSHSPVPVFSQSIKVGTVTTLQIEEATGLAASRRHPGILYTQNDSGDSSRIIALNAATGKRVATLNIRNAQNYDWADIAVSKCHRQLDKYCIYVADTGDHGGKGAANVIYRIEEPIFMSDRTVDVDSKLYFSWNQADAETLLVDPDGEVFLISKVVGGRGKIVQLPSSNWGTNLRVTVDSAAFLPIHTFKKDPVGGDISPNGDEILIKAREHVFYWKKKAGESYNETLLRPPGEVSYKHERNGQSICWSSSASGYYTLDEGFDQPLHYFARQ